MANLTTDDLKQLLLNRNFILITLINFLIMLGDYQYFVTSALFSLKLFNAHLSEAGFISGLMVVGCFIGRFFTGNLINLLGPKKTLIIGAVSTLLSTLCSLVAFNLVIFGFERFWFGFSIGMLSTATGTIIAYCLNASMQGFGISIFSLSTALSLALGPFIALEVYQNFGVNTVDVEVNVLCALGLMACFLIKNPPHLAKSNTSFFKISNYIDFRVLKFATTALIIPIGYGCISAYLAAMCEERQIADAAGLFFLVGAFVTILSRPVFGRLFDKFGENLVMYPAIIFASLSLLILAMANSAFLVVISAIFHGLGLSNFQSSGQALALKLVDRSRYAQATSTFFMLWDFSLGITPSIFGLIAHYWGFAVMFEVLALIVFLGAVLYYFVHGKDHPLKKRLFKA